LGCLFIIKEGRRRRYIGFKIFLSKDITVDKKDMINALKQQCRKKLKKELKDLGIFLIRFDGHLGIVRCNHIEKDNTIDLLNSLNYVSSQKVKIETIGTSGTIKSLIKKHMNN